MEAALVGALGIFLLVLSSLPQSNAQNITDPCKGVDCQQGDCVPEILLYSCKCRDGWTQLMGLPILPCGIPDCQLNYSCDNSTAPAPAPAPITASNSSSPCLFPGLCGNGICSLLPNPGFLQLPYECNCNPGNSNLFNKTAGICLPTCNLNASCKQLGINLTPPSAPPASSPSAGIPSHADVSPSSGNRQKDVARGLGSSIFVIAVVWLWL